MIARHVKKTDDLSIVAGQLMVEANAHWDIKNFVNDRNECYIEFPLSLDLLTGGKLGEQPSVQVTLEMTVPFLDQGVMILASQYVPYRNKMYVTLSKVVAISEGDKVFTVKVTTNDHVVLIGEPKLYQEPVFPKKELLPEKALKAGKKANKRTKSN